MDREQQLRELVEADGRYRLVRLGTFYRDPLRDHIDEMQPFTGAIVIRREAIDSRGRPYAEVPIHPQLLYSFDADVLSGFILERADEAIEHLISR